VTPELPPLGEVIRRHRLGAVKALGQHFLLDRNLTRRIARAAGPLDRCAVIEIGPGPGGLTRALLLEGARHVTAIERDRRAIAALEELAACFPGRLRLIEADALAVDPAEITAAPRKIVANLPYNIATALLLRWLGNVGAYQGLTLMFQKEVAQRLAAAPGGKAYGRLAVMTQWRAVPRLLFDIAPTAFVPPPKVTSTLVEIVPRPEPLAPCRADDLARVTAAAFGQRRKMLRAALRSLAVDPLALLRSAGIDPTERAEKLTVEQFAALARAYAALIRPAGD
jgi:16S rRNA (adenine1518-N6/adenine1519-N6)-dimethyltransferase